jgi:hypothetical protein
VRSIDATRARGRTRERANERLTDDTSSTTERPPPSQDAQDARDEASAKAYLETHVTSALHDALVALNAARPADPLAWLGEYLVKESAARKAKADAA